MTKTTAVTIDTKPMGQRFAVIGIVRRNGRIIHRGIERPYGFDSAALRDAREWAEDHGYRVTDDAE